MVLFDKVRTRVVFWLPVLLVAVAWGCSSEKVITSSEGGDGDRCYAGGTCDDGLSCVEGVCQSAGGAEGEGEGEGEGAAEGEGEGAAPAEGEIGGPCRGDGTCDEGLTCEDEVCTGEALPGEGTLGHACHPDGSCDGGLVCEQRICIEDPTGKAGGPCRDDGSCDGDLECTDDVCRTACEGDAPAADKSVGACAGATKACEGTDWVEPDYGELPEYEAEEVTCDEVDNDCDGEVDEGLQNACDTCGDVPAERCDGEDNDCNGQVDDIAEPPAASRSEGVCAGLVRRCDGVGWVDPDYAGVEGYELTETLCDGLDNDCDGQVDENLDTPNADRQEGVCAGSRKVCGGDGGFVEPDYGEIADYVADEAGQCDRLDNDCDGRADEGCQCNPGQETSCGSDVGVCEKGTATCQDNGQPGQCLGAIEGTPEECDGRDNNCNGQTDDGLQAPDARNQRGVCEGALQECNGRNGWQEPDYAGYSRSYQASETRCDGLDNDCDGAADGADDDVPWPAADRSDGDGVVILEPGLSPWSGSQTIVQRSQIWADVAAENAVDGTFHTGADIADYWWADMVGLPTRTYFKCKVTGGDLSDGLRVNIFLAYQTQCDVGCSVGAFPPRGGCCGAGEDGAGRDGCTHRGIWTRQQWSGSRGNNGYAALDLRNPNGDVSWAGIPCAGRSMWGRLVAGVRYERGTLDACRADYTLTCTLSNSSRY